MFGNDKQLPFLSLFMPFLPNMGGIGTVPLEVYGAGLTTLAVVVVLVAYLVFMIGSALLILITKRLRT